MGNCCGKPEGDDSPQPRVTGTSSTGAHTASVPRKVGGPGRTLGGPSSGSGDASAQDDARRKAAEAAEARAKAASTGGGKLQSQLAAQKKQNRNDTLKEASEQALRERESASAAEARNWN